ncbi:MAG TPA: chemotaxis protein CheB [Bryobacteraceae bacterium]|nr:chemotaxis protein CheB [Bryobacteraceae bacterium]
MPGHDIIVIGASAGGVEAVQKVVAQLPADLPAAVFVVIHLYPLSLSHLPEILTRAGKLKAVDAPKSAAIEPGRIYVAPPDSHLVIERDHLVRSSGPKEQNQRPSINVTLRSAAMAYGARAVGVLLTGQMDDGVAGLWEIKCRGGVAVVQNPEEAIFPSMPLSALREIEVDYTVNLANMGPLLLRLATGQGEQQRTRVQNPAMEPKLTDLTCPDCRGTIWEVPRGRGSEFRCRVGHTFSPRTMLAEHSATQERALYSAAVALEEGASLASRLAAHFDADTAAKLREEARERETQAKDILRILNERRAFNLG